MAKPVVDIYINPSAESGKKLAEHIAIHIDQLNKHLIINFIHVTKANSRAVMQKGVTRTPTLIYHNEVYEGLDKIKSILTPKNSAQSEDPDEMMRRYQEQAIDVRNHNNVDDEEDDDNMSPESRNRELQQKMAALQKKRPVMQDVDSKQKIPGGRKTVAKQSRAREYTNDDDFLSDTGDKAAFVENNDGELMLEEYYLGEAIQSGKKSDVRRHGRKY